MSAHHSTAAPREYHPTIIENKLLITRLAIQIAFVKTEFKKDPAGFVTRSIRDALSSRQAMPVVVAVAVVVVLTIVLLVKTNRPSSRNDLATAAEPAPEITLLDMTKPASSVAEHRIGKDGPGRVGLQNDKGEGSGPSPRIAQGGGGGGNHNPTPPQTGKLPPPSPVPAAIPIAPPVNPPALPAAGIDIDPALWKDLKAPVYGDPRSTSETPSKGPGEKDGIGTKDGLGIGDGSGPGFGPGNDGNTGGGRRQVGCCGPGGGSDQEGQLFRGSEVEQRARLLSKPEPQYTEEARQNQVSGTVMLRAVFSSSGEVIQIRAVHTLPFGLTERAIAAARQIKFVPAMKSGRPVSVYMQLEYNFNLY